MKGSCLCGAVRYEVDRLAGPIGHCHCNTCRKSHGAAFNSTARANRTDFRWVAGTESLSAFESSPGKLRHFCRKCGSRLIAEWVAQPQVVVCVATLDEDPGQRPAARIWLSHAVPWLPYDQEIPHFEKTPRSGA
jgi:hypothetical protein